MVRNSSNILQSCSLDETICLHHPKLRLGAKMIEKSQPVEDPRFYDFRLPNGVICEWGQERFGFSRSTLLQMATQKRFELILTVVFAFSLFRSSHLIMNTIRNSSFIRISN